MPQVIIETWPMDDKMKAEVIRKITDVFVEMHIPAEAVTVVLHEVPKENWGTAGEQHSVKYK